LQLEKEAIVFTVSNQVPTDRVDELEDTFQELVNADPVELLMQRVEQSVSDPDDNSSGIRFLTIINDYGANVSWEFDDCDRAQYARLTVTTRFPVQRSDA
jgi:hypothetical protein